MFHPIHGTAGRSERELEEHCQTHYLPLCVCLSKLYSQGLRFYTAAQCLVDRWTFVIDTNEILILVPLILETLFLLVAPYWPFLMLLRLLNNVLWCLQGGRDLLSWYLKPGCLGPLIAAPEGQESLLIFLDSSSVTTISSLRPLYTRLLYANRLTRTQALFSCFVFPGVSV